MKKNIKILKSLIEKEKYNEIDDMKKILRNRKKIKIYL